MFLSMQSFDTKQLEQPCSMFHMWLNDHLGIFAVKPMSYLEKPKLTTWFIKQQVIADFESLLGTCTNFLR